MTFNPFQNLGLKSADVEAALGFYFHSRDRKISQQDRDTILRGAVQNGDLLGSGTDTDIIAKARQDIGAPVSCHSAAVTEGFLVQALLGDSPHVFYPPPDKAQAEIDTMREAVRKDPDVQQDELLKTALYTAVEADTNAKFERQASDHGAQIDGARRLDEIRKLRRNDPDSYEKNAAMQAEELRFISAA